MAVVAVAVVAQDMPEPEEREGIPEQHAGIGRTRLPCEKNIKRSPVQIVHLYHYQGYLRTLPFRGKILSVLTGPTKM